MQKLIQRIGTEARKFKFVVRLDQFRSKQPLPGSYRLSLRREDKQIFSNYFKAEPSTDVSLHEVVKLVVTMYCDKKTQIYQSKKFELVIWRNHKDQQVEQSRFELELGEVASRREVDKVFQDKNTTISLKITGEQQNSEKPGQTEYNNNFRFSYKEGRHQRQAPNQDGQTYLEHPHQLQQRPIEVIKFQEEVEREQPLSQPFNTLVAKARDPNTSFKDLNIRDKDKSRSQDRMKRRIREGTKPKQSPGIIPITLQAGGVKQKLSQIQSQLGNERMRRSTVYQALNQQKGEIIDRLKQDNSELNATLNRFTNQLQFCHKQAKDLQARYDSISKKLSRTIQENRQIKQQRDRLVNQVAELSSAIGSFKDNALVDKRNQSPSKQNPGTSKTQKQVQHLQKQIQQLQKQVHAFQAQFQSWESERVIMQSRYHQIIKKYKTASAQLSAQKASREEQFRKHGIEQRQTHKDIKQKDQSILALRQNVKDLELRLLRPEDQLNKKQHGLLKQRLQKLMASFAEESRENKELQGFLKREIEAKKKENQSLMDKLTLIEKSQGEQMSIYVNREKSLTRALEDKNKKIIQLTQEVDRLKAKAIQSSRFIETEKVQLVKKMSFLSDQLTKRKEVSEQLAISENRNKQLETRIKRMGAEKEQLQIEVDRLRHEVELGASRLKSNNASLAFVQQLQGQLVKVNTKVAHMMTLIFQKDPRLAQSIIEELGRS